MKTSTVVVVLLAGALIGALVTGILAVAVMSLRSSSRPSDALAGSAGEPMMAAPPAEMAENFAGLGGVATHGAGPGGGGRAKGEMKKMMNFAAKADQADRAPMAPAAVAAPKPKAPAAEGGERGGSAEGAPTRAWFPETFLFEPLVVTDASGLANVPVKVPDRLTSWRVLALAHSREGAQAGAVASFLGTLPAYVDPVVPAFLMAGDEVRLPVQVVNTTDRELSTSLTLSATFATLSSAGGALKVPAEGNQVQYVTLKAPRAGTVGVKAVLGGTDAIERTIDVKPSGMLQTVSAGGTLASPRTLELEGPLQPLDGSEKVRLMVFPGALSLVRAELSAAPGRGGVAEDAYTLLLAGRAAGLLTALGATPDAAAIRDLGVLAGQRAIRHARSPDVPSAVLLAEAALQHEHNPVLTRLGERLAAQVAGAQRPDGTCQGADGWTLQRLLVTTSECVRAVRSSQGTSPSKARAAQVTIKASGAFERNLARIGDGYTAAAALASGAVSGSVKDALRLKVLADVESRPDGSKVLTVQKGVVRPDGLPPSVMEATALAVLALLDDPQAPTADLGTALLGGYSPAWGWGDGRANLVALRAVTAMFKEKVPADVRIVLERDGQGVVSGTLDAAALQDVLSLQADAAGSAGHHTWTVRSEPAVAGLGYSLTLQAHVPWKEDEASAGLELTVSTPPALAVGAEAALVVSASAPAGEQTVVRLALPAGAQPDRPSLDALVSAGQVTRFETEDGAVVLHLAALGSGATFTGTVKVVPTLAGSLHASANTMSLEGQPQVVRAFAPRLWQVK